MSLEPLLQKFAAFVPHVKCAVFRLVTQFRSLFFYNAAP